MWASGTNSNNTKTSEKQFVEVLNRHKSADSPARLINSGESNSCTINRKIIENWPSAISKSQELQLFYKKVKCVSKQRFNDEVRQETAHN